MRLKPCQGEQRRSGTVAIMVAVSLTALMAFAAITLDGGLLLDDRWRAQAAADAAALSAAASLYQNYAQNQGYDPNHTAQQSALNTAAANGYSNDGVTSTVTVNIPPKTGDHAAQAGYAEVIVQYNQPRYFSGIFSLFNSDATGAIPVVARSVARGLSTPGSVGGIIVLNPTVAQALNVGGNGDLYVKSGAVIVDSNSSQAAALTGNGNVYTQEVDITGSDPGYITTGSGNFITSPIPNNIKTGQLPTPDPLANLPAPDPSSLPIRSTQTLTISSHRPTILLPGRYIGGIQVSANGNVILAPGIYYLDHGGLSDGSNAKIIGDGVMLYNDPTPGSDQQISIIGNGDLELTPPISGVYQGIVIFQSRGAGNVPVVVNGNGHAKWYGTVYAPSSPVTITGNGNVVVGSQYISDTLSITGNGDMTIDWSGYSASNQRDLRIVE